MASDEEPQVFVQLRAQTSTENLSDSEFTIKTRAAAARINAYQSARDAAALRPPYVISPSAARLSVIPEDGHSNHLHIQSLEGLPTTSSSPDEYNFPLVHPGSVISLSPRIHTSCVDYEGGDFAEPISEDIECAVQGASVNAGTQTENVSTPSIIRASTQAIVNASPKPKGKLSKQFTITRLNGSQKAVAGLVSIQSDGSIKDVTSEVDILKTDHSIEDLISDPTISQLEPDSSNQDLHNIVPWTSRGRASSQPAALPQQATPKIAPLTSQSDANSRLLGSPEQATPEIAPFLWQDIGSAQPSTPTSQTLQQQQITRKVRTNRSSRTGLPTSKHPSEDLEYIPLEVDIGDTRHRSFIPQPTSPRVDCLANTPRFTPSPRSATSSTFRKIRSRISFRNLRKPTSKFSSSADLESYGQSTSTLPVATSGQGNESLDSTIGGIPYEAHTSGPAPIFQHPTIPKHLVKDTEEYRLSIATKADHPFEAGAAMDAIMDTPATEVNDAAVADHDLRRNASTETIIPTPRVSSRRQASAVTSHQHPATASSFKKTREEFHSDAGTLFNSPPPILSDHPMNRPSQYAFQDTTEYPLISTSTSALQIQALAKDFHQLTTKSAGFGEHVRKKKSYRNLGGLLTRSAPPTQIAFGSELSPTTAARNIALVRSSDSSGPPTASSVASTVEPREKRSILRKVSTIFNKGSKTPESSIVSPTESQNSSFAIIVRDSQPAGEEKGQSGWEILKLFKKKQHAAGIEAAKEELEYLDNHIRNHLAYHKKDYKPIWPLKPPHPNNPAKAWDHANLRCAICLPDFCGCCGKVCCAHQALTTRLSLFSRDSEESNGLQEMLEELSFDIRVKPDPKNDTKELRDTLEALYPSVEGVILGGETQTFLNCTECKKMVCPKCCGLCPEEGCAVLKCRKCGGDVWGPCALH